MGNREKRARSNIIFTLAGQLVTIACGLIVPRLLIGQFGSEAYGATASIAQFLAYISLLDGGVSGVARAALYKPLAMQDGSKIRAILLQIRKFFRIIALIFLVYMLVLACIYKQISNVQSLDWITTFVLVIVIGVSIFMEYFLGISYSILINAAQKTYVIQIISIVTTVINTALVMVLVFADCSLIVVKLISSLVFICRPVAMWLYVKKTFDLSGGGGSDAGDLTEDPLKQKWTGLAQHIAYVLHSNTDVVVLTLFSSLDLVAVYSVYQMVISGVERIAHSFSSGMEALFGELLARKEFDELNKTFDRYESLISFVAGTLFSVTAVMMIPFVRLYTSDINDVNYIYPAFGLVLVIASYLFCIRLPYHAMVIASGSFKQTRVAAYGEASINALLSVILVIKFGLLGAAIGTVVAVAFRMLCYVFYLKDNVFGRRVFKFVLRFLLDALSFVISVVLGSLIAGMFDMSGFIRWCICAAAVTAVAAVVNYLFLFLSRRIHV